MTLEQLRIFLAVAQHLHFTRAAAALNLTQPAVSSAIAALEQQHGVRLFDRIGRTVHLSEAGKALLDDAGTILHQVETACLRLADLSGLRQGAVSLMASQTVGNYWLPSRLQRCAVRYPGLSFSLRLGNTSEAAAAVLAGTTDVAVVEGTVDDPRFSRHTFNGDQMVLVVGPQHPVFGKPPPSLGQLAGWDWLAREEGSGTREAFVASLAALGVPQSSLRIVLSLPTGEALRSALLSSGCAAVVSRLVVGEALASGKLWQVDVPLPRRQFTLLLHVERYHSAAVRAFVTALQDEDEALLQAADAGAGYRQTVEGPRREDS